MVALPDSKRKKFAIWKRMKGGKKGIAIGMVQTPTFKEAMFEVQRFFHGLFEVIVEPAPKDWMKPKKKIYMDNPLMPPAPSIFKRS